jgi:uncharacterized protein (DUF2236 family)
MRPHLRADERTRAVAQALLSQSPTHPALAPFGRVLLKGGVELLPGWAAEMHGIGRPPPIAVRTGVHGIGRVMRWALRDSSAKRAQLRVAGIRAEQNQNRSR